MSHSFLHHVARDLRRRFGTSFADVVIVFPNKRAGLFLEPSLLKDVDTPVWSPRYITISELFHTLSPLRSADELQLLSILYQCYAECTQTDESFDSFFSWGQVLMSDFDDIDKHLADAQMVFSNISHLHEFDSIAYLTEEQKQRIAEFFNDFSDNQESRLKHRFLHVWNRLGAVYDHFTSLLLNEGIGYEGLLQRQAVSTDGEEDHTDSKLDAMTKHFVFVGFNFLQPVERKLLQRVKQHHHTLFYWDYDNYYLNDIHEAGESIRENIQLFGNALAETDENVYDNFSTEKDITLISTPSENILARYVTQWLNEEVKDNMSAYPPNTAIVLCNERLLPAVVHAIPQQVSDTNITIGYPMAETAAASFVNNLLLFFHHGHGSDGRRLRLKYVAPLLAHPLTQITSTEAPRLLATLQKEYGFFPPKEAVTVDEYLAAIFTVEPTKENDTNAILALSQWLLHIVDTTAHSMGNQPQRDVLTFEALFKLHTLLTRLHNLVLSGTLTINLYTYEQVLRQLISQASIPFHGEPAIGLQVMGMLETRNLDFDNVLLLSCQEQYLPNSNSDISYIPYILRKAFSLTTHEHKESMQSYYFYRLLQRAKKVTLAYCDAPNGLSNGEMSRFILQLLVEGPHRIQRQALTNSIALKPFLPDDIEKTPTMMSLLTQREYFSPTAINNYLSCPRRFFYEYVANIRKQDDTDEDNIDQRIFGTLFHRVVETLYRSHAESHMPVTKTFLEGIIKQPSIIERAIDDAMYEEMGGSKRPSQKNAIHYNGTLLIIRKVLLRYTLQLLSTDKQFAPFHILGLEQDISTSFNITTSDGQHTVQVQGIIDRLDAVIDNEGKVRIRVIDYKTGSPDSKAIHTIDDLFEKGIDRQHRGYFLQTSLYSLMVADNIANGKLSLATLIPGITPQQCQEAKIAPALLYIRNYNDDNADPTLCLDKTPIYDITKYTDDIRQGVGNTLTEIFDINEVFEAAPEDRTCANCHCRLLCNFAKSENKRPA